ncbi:hypothetical protein Tco_0598683 [Tanacetum coccineum]
MDNNETECSPSEVVEHGMDDHAPNEIDGAKYEQVPNHVVNKGNLEVLVCKQVANHGRDELVDKGRPLKRKRMESSFATGFHYFVSKATTLVKQSSGQTPLEKLQDHLYERRLLLNPSQREELEDELTSREELVVLQVEFADMEGQMQQLMEELKKSQKNAFFWKSTAIVFGVVASFMFVMN